MKVLIINTGGTFNKEYNPLNGNLEVRKDSKALEEFLFFCYNLKYEIKNIISKDSLEMTQDDRKTILNIILNSKQKNIIVIHGTDTMDLSAYFIAKELEKNILKNPKKIKKRVIFTGAMIPVSINKIEANINFSNAIGFINAKPKSGVYISMHASVKNYKKLIKNRSLGQFLNK